MTTSDERQFEEYLKQFRPLAPESLEIGNYELTARRRASFARWVAVAVVVIAAVLMLWPRSKPNYPGEGTRSLAGLEQLTNVQPLTLGSVNVLLAHAPSLEAAVELVAFQHRTSQPPKGTQSALALLSKENTLP